MAEDKPNSEEAPAGEEEEAAAGGTAQGAEVSDAREGAGAGEEPPEPTPEPKRGGRGGLWLGLIALLAAVVGAGAGGYAYWQLQQRLAQVDERLAAARQERSQARETLADLRGELDSVAGEQEGLAGRVGDLSDQVESVRRATEELYARIEGGPDYWRLERVESLLVAADRVVRLEHDGPAAYAALAEADRMLRELKDPAWLDVREAIQAAMTRLEQVKSPDVPGIAFRLASLSQAALGLPLQRQEPPALGKEEAEAAAGQAPEGAWGRVKGALGRFWEDVKGLVRLRRAGEDIEPLLPPDKAAFLRHNLVLNLQAARLAVLRREPEVYRESLASARDWTARFFDRDSEEVAGMLGALEELQERRIAPELPELDKPLTLLRRLRQERGN